MAVYRITHTAAKIATVTSQWLTTTSPLLTVTQSLLTLTRVLFADVESRAKYDTEQKLKTNQAEQKALNEVALQQDLDLKQKKIEQKITVSGL